MSDNPNKDLLEGIINDNPENMRQAIDAGADVNLVGSTFISPLELALRYKRIAPAKMLMDHGATINIKTHGDTQTLLAMAISLGCNDTALDMIARGAAVNEKSFGGITPLMEAVIHRRPEVLDALIGKKAEINVVSDNRKTALIFLFDNFDHKADLGYLQKLLDAGADPDLAPGQNGMTALMLAAACRSLAATNILMKHGARLDQKNAQGQTARDIARAAQYDVMAWNMDAHAEKRVQKRMKVIEDLATKDTANPVPPPKKIRFKK